MLKNWKRSAAAAALATRRLHIGGEVRKDGWEVLNAQPGPAVDHVGNARDLSRFADATFSHIYASHILEHLDYTGEMQSALHEWFRVLAPGGELWVSVPDLTSLAKIFLDPRLTLEARFSVMRMIYGGHDDAWDYHKVGFDFGILENFLIQAGFVEMRRVENFGLFEDYSAFICAGMPISLNVTARRPGPAPDV